MRTEAETLGLFLFGMPEARLERSQSCVHMINSWGDFERRALRYTNDLFVIRSNWLLHDDFVEGFRENATRDTKLLILNDCLSADSLVCGMVDLQIRSAHRFYIVDLNCDTALNEQWLTIESYITRLSAVAESSGRSKRILDARFEEDCLKLVSTGFQRLEVLASRIPAFSNIARSTIGNFEIDEDGSYLYWPDVDVHLGWEQFDEVVNPDAARKAMQQSNEFNSRYGAAIRRVREQAEIPLTGIQGLSDKQLRRIERGESRATSNALEKLAKAHGLEINEYLETVAMALN